ncbi:MAG: arginine--tRNA ligase [Candidatus Omnitrophota bacterium]
MLPSLKKQLEDLLEKSVRENYDLPPQTPPAVLEIPVDKAHGEFSSNVALRLAKSFRQTPLDFAVHICRIIEQNIPGTALHDKVVKVEAKAPGFINFYLTPEALYDVLYQVFAEGSHYGSLKRDPSSKLQIEFVSANPTGPLSVAHARQAAVGDALANILGHLGFAVQKEYYVNDEGNQINILGRSIEQRAREMLGEKIDFPQDGYQGEYIKEMAKEFCEKNNIARTADLAGREEQFRRYGVTHLLGVIRKELDDFGVHFDIWSKQSHIATPQNIETTLNEFRQKGFLYEKEGALWFRSTTFGDDKDRVVRKSDGSYTYLTPDIVYHKNKFERGFKKIINIWGPDHHGYIPRIKASVEALGHNQKDVDVLIVQLATIYRAGKPLSMSTRRGQYISLREVMDEVGGDAARFFFLMRRINAHLDFDLELAKKETPENPVYYVQYAHARIHSILDKAQEAKLKAKTAQLKLLNKGEELELIKTIGQFPDALSICHHQLDPFALVNYVQELATSFHKFYDQHRVIDEDQELSSERLALIEAARIVLANGLRLLGVNAPQRM